MKKTLHNCVNKDVVTLRIEQQTNIKDCRCYTLRMILKAFIKSSIDILTWMMKKKYRSN